MKLAGRRTVRLAIFVLGLVGLVIALRRAIDESHGQALPDARSLIVAGLLTFASLILAGQAWVRLFDDRHDRRALAVSLYASQLTKYLPAGGFVQAAGQVSMTVTAGAGLGQAATATAVMAFTTVVAGCTLSAALVFAGSLPAWLRAISLLGLLAPVLLHRRVLAVALHAAHRLVRRVPDPDTLPSQRRLLVSYAWALGNSLAGSAAYAVLLRSPGVSTDRVTVIAAFAFSWVVGFLVFPLPGGIGVREAVLVAVVPGASSAALLGASLAQRFLLLASEVLLAFGSQLFVWSGRRMGPVSTADVAPTGTSHHETTHADGAEGADTSTIEDVRTGPASDAR